MLGDAHRVLGLRLLDIDRQTGLPASRLNILNRSRRRFFFSFSLGLLATPSSQESTLAIVTVVFFLGRFHPDRQPRRWAKGHFRKNTSAECGDGFHRGFVETLGWNSNGVLDAFLNR